mmetsp:Transcript_19966/g.3260  ORF Transcript_19966/g.3260 Transcript_19966/m.3260 type:complete len:90 (+) Transcript_19966:237-506(+)
MQINNRIITQLIRFMELYTPISLNYIITPDAIPRKDYSPNLSITLYYNTLLAFYINYFFTAKLNTNKIPINEIIIIHTAKTDPLFLIKS